MRQGQQNRRGRGRNRKGQNPLTRSFESNGPDIKIRGTPSHIAEKYVSLARDALSSGDPVLAENYLQHAEHYNRIIMTYREQQIQQGEGSHGSGHGRQREQFESSNQDDGENAGDDAAGKPDGNVPRGHEPQPTMADDGGSQSERRARRANGDGRRRRGPSQENSGNGEDGGPDGERKPRRRERYAQRDDQPDFLKRPVRKPRAKADDADGDGAGAGPSSDEAEADSTV